MFERFTTTARQAVIAGQEQAWKLSHPEVTAEDLLLGAIQDPNATAARVLRDCGLDRERLRTEVASFQPGDSDALQSIGIDLDSVRRRVEEVFGPGAFDRPARRLSGLRRGRGVGGGYLRFSIAAKQALEEALHQARALGHDFLSAEHVVLGLLATDTAPAAASLARLGVDLEQVRARLIAELRRAA